MNGQPAALNRAFCFNVFKEGTCRHYYKNRRRLDEHETLRRDLAIFSIECDRGELVLRRVEVAPNRLQVRDLGVNLVALLVKDWSVRQVVAKERSRNSKRVDLDFD